jgi:type III secretory pathway component EscV
LGTDLAARFAAGSPERERLAGALGALREALASETGVPLPAPVIRAAPVVLPPAGWWLVLFDVPFAQGELGPGADLEDLVGPVRAALRRHAGQFLGHQEVQELLDRLEETAPALVRAVTPKPLSLERLVAVLKILVEEGVSIRDLRRVLESAVAHGAEKDPYALAERIRADGKRAMTAALTGGGAALRVVLVAPEVEDVLREAIKDLGDGPRMLVDPETAEAVIRAAKAAFAALDDDGRPRVVLTQPEIRRHLWRLLDLDLPDVRVVSYRELDPGVRLERAGTIVVGAASGG